MQNTPQQIEKESFKIISASLDSSHFQKGELAVITRIIHATADFEFANMVQFSSHAISSALTAIQEGAPIITDVNMVRVGINTALLSHFGIELFCRISDSAIVTQAKAQNTTRAITSMRNSSSIIDGGIVVIGNAPTALHEVVRLIKEEKVVPRLVIGMPVGFVEAKESKEALMKLSGVPYISNQGRKGGSAVAAAAMNALLKLAKQGEEGENI